MNRKHPDPTSLWSERLVFRGTHRGRRSSPTFQRLLAPTVDGQRPLKALRRLSGCRVTVTAPYASVGPCRSGDEQPNLPATRRRGRVTEDPAARITDRERSLRE